MDTDLYRELHELAENQLRKQERGHTLQPTALVNEAWIKLAREPGEERDRRHFICLAARAMRQVLVDHARKKRSEKRGDAWRKVTLLDPDSAPVAEPVDLIVLNDALERLAALSEQQAQIVELRFFAGSTMQETADALGASLSDVERKWRMARAWLSIELRTE